MTNGDVIRRMSNEQLATFLANERTRLARSVFERIGFGIESQIVYLSLLRWLNEVAGEEESAGG